MFYIILSLPSTQLMLWCAFLVMFYEPAWNRIKFWTWYQPISLQLSLYFKLLRKKLYLIVSVVSHVAGA